MRHAKLELSAKERKQLQVEVKRGHEWRERERAQTLLYFAEGWSGPKIAAALGCGLESVYARRKRWLETDAAYAQKKR